MTAARKYAIAGTGAVTALLMMAGPAFACTTYLGKLTVTPNSARSSGSVTADGNGLSMGYCSGPTGTADFGGKGTVSVKVGTTTSCIVNNHLTANTTYTKSWLEGGVSTDCMYGTQTVGTFTTDSNGAATAKSKAFTPSTGTLFQFCVSNKGNHTGNQVGLTGVV